MHPLFSQLEASGVSNPLEFLVSLYEALKGLAKNAIDTPEERQGIEKAVFSYYDKVVDGHVPMPMREAYRKSLYDMLDATLKYLASA